MFGKRRWKSWGKCFDSLQLEEIPVKVSVKQTHIPLFCLLFFLHFENLIFKPIIFYFMYMCNTPNIQLMRKTRRKV